MRVLFVAHGFPPSSMGGTEIYASTLARALGERRHEVLVLAREARPDLPEYHVRRDTHERVPVVWVNNTFRKTTSFEETYRNAEIDEVARGVLAEFRPDVVHAHHLTCLSTGIVDACASSGIPVVLTLHDYWLFCHRGQLLDLGFDRCAGPVPGNCAICAGLAASDRTGVHRLARILRAVDRHAPPALADARRRLTARLSRGIVPASAEAQMARRLENARRVCASVARLLAPSRTALEQLAAFGVPRSRLTLWQQGIDLRPFRGLDRQPSSRLRLGFLGSLTPSKAPHVLLEAVAGLPADRVSLTIAGAHTPYHGDDRYAGRLRPLLAAPGVRWLDAVKHEEIPGLLASVDVLVVPSVWTENAPLVIREAFAAGAPVVASNLGGMAESVTDGRDGLLFDPGSSADLHRVLRRFLDEPGLLHRLRGGIGPVTSIEDDAEAVARLYEETRSEARRARVAGGSPKTSAVAPPITAVVLNYRTPDDTLLAVRSLQASRRTLRQVIVVDNSADPTRPLTLPQSPVVARVVETGGNLGFSGGCNVGITEALNGGAELILLLNSDAVVSPSTVGELERALAEHPDAGMAAPLVVSRADPGIVASAGIRYSPTTGRMRHEGFGARADDFRQRPPATVRAASGCAMLIRRGVFEAVGLFDDRYFFSFEDIEFCLRAGRAGWPTVLVPAAAVYHEGHASIGAGSAARLYFATRNHLLLAAQAGPLGRFASIPRTAAIVLLNFAYALRTSRVGRISGCREVIRGALDHFRGKYGPASQARS